MALQRFVSLPVTKSQLLHNPSKPLTPQSKLVLEANCAVGEILDYTTFVECFQAMRKNLQNFHALFGIDSAGEIVAGLCDESIAVLGKYRSSCTEILRNLQATYENLVTGHEDEALDFFSNVAGGAIQEVYDSTKKLKERCQDAYKLFDKKSKELDSLSTVTEMERVEKGLAEIVTRYEKDSMELRRVRTKMRVILSASAVRSARDVMKSHDQQTGFTAEAVGEKDRTTGKRNSGNADTCLAEDKIQDLTEALTSPLAIWTQSSQAYVHSSRPPIRSHAKNESKNLLHSLIDTRKRTVKKSREYLDQLDTFHDAMLDDVSECQASVQRILRALEVVSSIADQAMNFWLGLSNYCKVCKRKYAESFRKDMIEVLSTMSAQERKEKWESDEFGFKEQALKFSALWTSLLKASDESVGNIKTTRDALLADRRQRKKDRCAETLQKEITQFMQEVGKEEQKLKKQERLLPDV